MLSFASSGRLRREFAYRGAPLHRGADPKRMASRGPRCRPHRFGAAGIGRRKLRTRRPSGQGAEVAEADIRLLAKFVSMSINTDSNDGLNRTIFFRDYCLPNG